MSIHLKSKLFFLPKAPCPLYQWCLHCRWLAPRILLLACPPVPRALCLVGVLCPSCPLVLSLREPEERDSGCAYVLGISAASPVCEEMALCRRCPMAPRLQFPLVTRARCSRVIPCVSFVWPPSVGGPQLLLAPSTLNNSVSLQFLLLTCSIMLHTAVINQMMLPHGLKLSLT